MVKYPGLTTPARGEMARLSHSSREIESSMVEENMAAGQEGVTARTEAGDRISSAHSRRVDGCQL